SVIVVLTVMLLAVILSTQFSFGRFFGSMARSAFGSLTRGVVTLRERREEKRREQQRREVIAKHTKKGSPPPEIKVPASVTASSNRMADPAGKPARKREEA